MVIFYTVTLRSYIKWLPLVFISKNILFLFVYSYICFFNKFLFFNFNVLDIVYRLNLNDSFLNLYAFFWTNFWYLPFFFITLFFIFIFFKKNYFSVGNVLILCLLGVYFYEIQDFNSVNHQLSFIDLNLNNFNFFLFNNINKYHPLLFYFSVCYTFFIFYFYLSIVFFSRNFFKKEKSLYINEKFIFFLFFFNFVSLYLGSWWALQEGTWGGWWNWDSSEVFGLLFLLISVFYLHVRLNLHNICKSYYSYFFLLLSVIISYYFIQLNFDLVSHNFGIKFFYFFNNNLFFLESIFLTSTLFFYFFKYYIFFFNNFYFLYKMKIVIRQESLLIASKFFLLFLLSFLFSKYILVSFGFLINYFFWNFLELNVFNSEINVYFYTIFLCLIVFYLLFRWCIFYLYLLLFLFLFHNFLLIYLYTNHLFFNFFTYLHYTLVNFLITNLMNLKLQISFWNLYYFFTPLVSTSISYISGSFYSCDSNFLEHSTPFYNFFNSFFNNWSVFFLLNFFHNNEFTFFCYFNSFFNLLSLNNTNFLVTLYVETLFLNNLIFFYHIFLLFVFFYNRKKCFLFY